MLKLLFMDPALSSHPPLAEPGSAPRGPTPTAFLVLMGLASFLMLTIVLPFWVPIFLGAVLAATLHPFFRWLAKNLRGHRVVAATLTTLAMLAALVAPLATLIVYAVAEVTQGLSWVQDQLHVESWREFNFSHLPGMLDTWVGPGLKALHVGGEQLRVIAGHALSYIQHFTPRLFSISLTAIANLILCLSAFFVFLLEGPALVELILRVAPLRRMHTRELLDEFQSVASASLIGMAITAGLQALVIMIGFSIAHVSHVIFFGIITLLAAFIPLVGSALVWVPVCISLAVSSRLGAAVALSIWSLTAISVVDNVIRPMVLKDRMAMHMALTFLGLLGGLAVFGPAGVVAGPLVVAFFTAVLRIYQRDYLGESVDGS